jgi:hypothetical protein
VICNQITFLSRPPILAASVRRIVAKPSITRMTN